MSLITSSSALGACSERESNRAGNGEGLSSCDGVFRVDDLRDGHARGAGVGEPRVRNRGVGDLQQ